MNRFVAALAATALIAPVAQAQEPPRAETRQEGRDPAPGKTAAAPPRSAAQAVPRHQYHVAVKQPHAWRVGDRFDRRAAPDYIRVVHVEHYGLQPPPRGHVWVRSGSDALLVRLSGNLVVTIRPGVFS